MYEILWFSLETSFHMIFYIMISIGFAVGIIIVVAPNAFEILNKSLNKEYGFRFRFFKKIEDSKLGSLERLVAKHSVIVGTILSVITFALLIIYK